MSENLEEWFAEWFDSPYYHVLYRHRDEEEAERFIAHLANQLPIHQADAVLDLACGKGRHTRMLAKYAGLVHGVDLSLASIQEAKSYQEANMTHAVHDMREVYLRDAFDKVFNLFTSFGYFDTEAEDLRVLEAIRQELKPGGQLVLDFMNAEAAVINLIPEETITREGIDFHIKRCLENGFFRKDIRFRAKGQNYHFTERVKALKEVDFRRLFEKTGFQVQRLWGDYDLGEYNYLASPRLIFLCQSPDHG